ARRRHVQPAAHPGRNALGRVSGPAPVDAGDPHPPLPSHVDGLSRERRPVNSADASTIRFPRLEDETQNAATAPLVNAEGTGRLGSFSKPIALVNSRGYALTTPLGRTAGRWARHFGFNQFQFLGALCDELVFGCALANIKYAGTAFVYLYDPAAKRIVE